MLRLVALVAETVFLNSPSAVLCAAGAFRIRCHCRFSFSLYRFSFCLIRLAFTSVVQSLPSKDFIGGLSSLGLMFPRLIQHRPALAGPALVKVMKVAVQRCLKPLCARLGRLRGEHGDVVLFAGEHLRALHFHRPSSPSSKACPRRIQSGVHQYFRSRSPCSSPACSGPSPQSRFGPSSFFSRCSFQI